MIFKEAKYKRKEKRSFKGAKNAFEFQQGVLQMWEHKVKEAKMTYELGVWFAKNRSRDVSDFEYDSFSDRALSSFTGARVVRVANFYSLSLDYLAQLIKILKINL